MGGEKAPWLYFVKSSCLTHQTEKRLLQKCRWDYSTSKAPPGRPDAFGLLAHGNHSWLFAASSGWTPAQKGQSRELGRRRLCPANCRSDFLHVPYIRLKRRGRRAGPAFDCRVSDIPPTASLAFTQTSQTSWKTKPRTQASPYAQEQPTGQDAHKGHKSNDASILPKKGR